MRSKTTAALQSRPSIVTEERCKDTTLISLVNQSPAKNCGLQVSNTDSQILSVTSSNSQNVLTILKIAGSNYLIAKQSVKMRFNTPRRDNGCKHYSSADFLANLRCLYCISRRSASVMNCPVLSPSDFVFSIPLMISCGILALTDCDLAFFEPVGISTSSNYWCKTIYTKKMNLEDLTCQTPLEYLVSYTLSCKRCEKDNAPDCRSSTEASNHNHLSEVKDMAVIQHTQTHPKFTWRFMALSADGLDIVHIEAGTEEEARALSPAGHVIIFAGRFNEGDRYDN